MAAMWQRLRIYVAITQQRAAAGLEDFASTHHPAE